MEFIYKSSVQRDMKRKRTVQTRLSDFEEHEDRPVKTSPDSRVKESSPPRETRPRRELWKKKIERREEWGVCNFDGTVLFVQLDDGRIHAHGTEAFCRWCGGVLVIHGEKVFCAGACKRYQGEFSYDLNAFLRWDGAKSYTLRKRIAEAEGLELEERDLAKIPYTSSLSVLEEYEEDDEEQLVP
ncbi:MAG: hypothetical protein ACFFAY_15170 [Promethearchaeota archaeon]